MQENHKQEMITNITCFLEKKPVFSGKSVIIFGHCNPAEELADYLLEHQVQPLCFLDNNPQKQGKRYGEIRIQDPVFIQSRTADDSIVLIVSRYYEPMLQQLRCFGFEGEVVEVVEYNSFQAFSTAEETFEKKVKRVREGYAHLQEVREHHPEAHLVLCPYAALGDVYWAMAFLKPYLRSHGITSYVVLVVGNACGQVSALFGTHPVLCYAQKTMDGLVQAFVCGQEENGIVAHHNHLYTDVSFQLLSYRFLHFSDYYKEVIYQLPKGTVAETPMQGEGLSESEAQSLGLERGKTVILAPYANSIVEVPLHFWEGVAQDYRDKGTRVFTNIVGNQTPVSGSQGLCLPLSQMIQAVEFAGCFVGLRSGICDVVHSANCEKYLVFPDCYFSDTPHKVADIFSLEGWERIIVKAKTHNYSFPTFFKNHPTNSANLSAIHQGLRSKFDFL